MNGGPAEDLSPPLPESFFEPAADVVAPRLLGHLLLRRTPAGVCGGVIVETEAYLRDDPACHAFRGETVRNRAMFGPPGHAYVYFIYGNHFCFNVVCQARGIGEAVLVRAIEVTVGEDIMRGHRSARATRDLTNGPGKLCRALAIDRAVDGVNLCRADAPVWITRDGGHAGLRRRLGPIVQTTRIGLSQAAGMRLRYYLAGSEFISRRAAGGR
jgi:DNA-3-methyladenine glycosylase